MNEDIKTQIRELTEDIQTEIKGLTDGVSGLSDVMKSTLERLLNLEGAVASQVKKLNLLVLDVCTLREQLNLPVSIEQLKQTELKMAQQRRQGAPRIVPPGTFRVPPTKN